MLRCPDAFSTRCTSEKCFSCCQTYVKNMANTFAGVGGVRSLLGSVCVWGGDLRCTKKGWRSLGTESSRRQRHGCSAGSIIAGQRARCDPGGGAGPSSCTLPRAEFGVEAGVGREVGAVVPAVRAVFLGGKKRRRHGRACAVRRGCPQYAPPRERGAEPPPRRGPNALIATRPPGRRAWTPRRSPSSPSPGSSSPGRSRPS